MADLRWTSAGGTLIDGSGDLATTLNSWEELASMVKTRIQAAVKAWQLYAIGAGLDTYIGSPVNNDTELSIQRAVTSALTKNFLASGTFTVQTVAIGSAIEVYVYINQQLLTSTTVSL